MTIELDEGHNEETFESKGTTRGVQPQNPDFKEFRFSHHIFWKSYALLWVLNPKP